MAAPDHPVQNTIIHPVGAVAVIFTAQRSGKDEAGYQAMAETMERLAEMQPGYLGMEHARSDDGLGITISYWADDTAAKAWRDQPDHREARDLGRSRYYDSYTLHVARIERGYSWP